MTNQHTPGPEAHARPDPASDEIDLTDLALIVWWRRRIVLAVVLLALLAGVAFAFMKPPAYEYKAVVEIGFLMTEGQGRQLFVPLDQPETVLTKLKEGYIPKAIAAAQAGEDGFRPMKMKIEANVPKNSTAIVVTAKGSLSHRDLYLKAIDSAVQELLEDHAGLLLGNKNAIEGSIMRARAESVLLDQRLNAIQADLEKLSGRQQAMAIQLDETQKHANASPQWIATLQSTLALLQSRIDQLENERSALQKAKSEKESEIALLESQAKNLRATRLVYGPRVSAEPVGIGRSIILALALVIGAFAGLMAAFITEFIANVRERLQEVTGTDVSAPVES